MPVVTTYSPSEAYKISPSVYRTNLTGLLYLPFTRYEDNRGFFAEISRIPEFEAVTGQPFVVKQVNQAQSNTNVVRGFHAEDWNKLVMVATGKCFCALVDVRPESSTFGQAETLVLGEGEGTLTGALYIPKGFANSVCVLAGPVNYIYCVDALYSQRDPKNDVAISLFDPDINLDWPIPREQMIYSQRDTDSQTLRQRFPEKF